jgi:hypothetical protein
MEIKTIIKIIKKQSEKDIQIIKQLLATNPTDTKKINKIFKRLKKVPKILTSLYKELDRTDSKTSFKLSYKILESFYKLYNDVKVELTGVNTNLEHLDKLVDKLEKTEPTVLSFDKLFLMKMMLDSSNNKNSSLLQETAALKQLLIPNSVNQPNSMNPPSYYPYSVNSPYYPYSVNSPYYPYSVNSPYGATYPNGTGNTIQSYGYSQQRNIEQKDSQIKELNKDKETLTAEIAALKATNATNSNTTELIAIKDKELEELNKKIKTTEEALDQSNNIAIKNAQLITDLKGYLESIFETSNKFLKPLPYKLINTTCALKKPLPDNTDEALQHLTEIEDKIKHLE